MPRPGDDGEVAAGDDQTMTLDADLSLGIGDYVLLVSGSAHEIVTVETVPTTLTFTGDFANTWADGSTIYRLLYYAPQASAQSVPKITGLQPGTNNASVNLDFTFASAADPVDNL